MSKRFATVVMSGRNGGKRVTGRWYSQFGSMVAIDVGDDGHISGKYYPAAGKADYYDLDGRLDLDPFDGQGIPIGWTVSLRSDKSNAHSTTTWSGQFFDTGHGDIVRIQTHWLLVFSTTPDKHWSSTNIGDDRFTRIKPSAEEVAQARTLSLGSPHPEDIIAALTSDR
ncbi:streptavidin [Mycena pura]|uniref:Streptavidin n=1 Tax=Mycena pura TaxID=153505 RepID=A0AAD6UVR7_9AGAR|nr:streptavidin [Mycena pura]